MAYDDIRISELPSLPDLHNNDLFLIQDVTNDLAHRIDWGRLKNSIGTLSKGIIFPLGTEEEPEIAIGDYTSGIMAEDYGQFAIVTHGEKRFKVVQSGSMELINGNVLIGNYDRQCLYTLIVNNLTTFNCAARFSSDVAVDGNLDVGGSITGGKNLNVPGNVNLGDGCDKFLVINAQIRGLCDMDLQGQLVVHDDLRVDNGARIFGNVALGTNCDNKLDVYSTAHFRCDLTVDGDLSFGGNLILDGDVSIGGGCNNTINLNGDTLVHCDLRVKGDTFLEKNLFVNANAAIDGNLNVAEDTILGTGCSNTVHVNAELIVQCNSFFRDEVVIGDDLDSCPATRLMVHGEVETKCDIKGHKDLYIDHNTTLGTDCNDDLLVKASSVFQCEANFEDSVNITEDLYVGGDLKTDSHIVDIGDDRGCSDPNLINLHGEVHIDCNLFVSGDVFYDGDLQITGPDITFGAGCGLSVINLQGYTIAHCDMLVKGDVAPYALTVEGNVEILKNTEMWGVLNVAGNSAHDSNLFVHEDVLLNLPVSAYDYWEQCECVDLSFPSTQKRGPDQTTFIHGTQKSLCQVYLNDPRWYIPCEGDARDSNNASEPHVQNTSVYGHFHSRSNVDLNSASADNPEINHKQITNVWAKFNQYSLVELNKGIDTSTSACGYSSALHATQTIPFNDHDNQRQTIIHGDLHSEKNVILNSDCSHLTQVMGKLQTQCDVYLNGDFTGGAGANNNANCNLITKIQGVQESFCDVYLNGQNGNYPSNTYKDCSKETIVWGKLYASCDVEFGNTSDHCQHKTILHTHLEQDATVQLNMDSGCCPVVGLGFNSTANRKHTKVNGDFYSAANVELNKDSGWLTRVNGRFEAREEARLEKNVHLNGGGTGNQKNCSTYTTTIWGFTLIKCNTKIDGNLEVDGNITGHSNLVIDHDATLGTDCSDTTTVKGTFISECSNVLGKPGQCGNNDFTTINGNLKLMNGIELDGGYGAVKVSEGAAGFFVSGGGSCIRNKWHHAVTTAKGTTPIGNSKSPINISVADSGGVTGSGDITISGEAGNGEYKVTTTGNGIVVGTGSVRANQTADTSQELSFSCSDANLGTLLGSDGVIGSYDPCGGKDQSIKFDCSTAGLGSLSTGNGISGGYEPCNGGSIAFECATAGLGTLAGSNGINGGYDPCGGKNQSITFDCSTANLGTLLGSDGISGAYDPCGGKNQSIKFDCSAAGLGDLSTGNGISGNYEPCKGGSIAFDCGSAGLGSLSTSNGISGNYEPCNGGSITFDCASAGLGGLSTGNGISGGYDPCGGGSVAFDCASAGLGSLSTGSGISGSYDPCGGGSITFDCASAGLGSLSTGNGISGNYNPCGGGSITFDCATAGLKTHTVKAGSGIKINNSAGGSSAYQPCGDKTTTISFDSSVLPAPTPPAENGVHKITGGSGVNVSGGDFTANQATGSTVTWNVALDLSECPEWTAQDRALKQVTTGPGTSGQPAIVINAKSAAKTWLGIKTNDGQKVFTVSSGTGWAQNGCTGTGSGGEKIFQVANKFETLGVNADQDTNGKPVYACRAVGGGPRGDTLNRLYYKTTFFRRGEITEISRSTDSRVNIDIDAAVAAFGGYSDDPETSGGLFRWGLKPSDGTETASVDALYPYLFVDSDEVANVLPYFVDYIPGPDAWEHIPIYMDDDYGGKTDVVDYYEDKIKEDFDPETQMVVDGVNQTAINGLALAGLARHKRLIDGITNDAELTGDTEVKGPITFGDIVKIDLPSLTDAADDTAAAAAGVEVGQVYRNGSQLMVRVS